MRNLLTRPLALCALALAVGGAAATTPSFAGDMRYSNTAALQAAPARTVQIAVDRTFTLYERAKILRAVNEWNTVLNGQIRLEISASDYDAATGAPPRGRGWTVARIDSRSPLLDGPAMKRTLAVTLGSKSAAIYVVADRIGRRDLAGIMMHEFGHALGIGHDSDSALMGPYYSGDKQGCIDMGAVVAVAASQGLALDGLNWCGGGKVVAAIDADDRAAQSIKARQRR